MIGFRAFSVTYGDGEAFLSPSVQMGDGKIALEYPTTEATCTKHRAPEEACTCGYHAYNDPQGAVMYAEGHGGVMADVWGHGKIERHLHGWRARNLQILAFYRPFCMNCKKAAETAVIGWGTTTASKNHHWLTPVAFKCTSCVRDGDAEVSLSKIFDSLCSKFGADAYSAEVTAERVAAFPEWREGLERAVAEHQIKARAAAREKARREAEEAERQRIHAEQMARIAEAKRLAEEEERRKKNGFQTALI